jgi:ABC-type multidrug transport system ATPase subunit
MLEKFMSSKIIAIDNLTKRYGSLVAVQRFNLTIDAGEVVVLLGGARTGKISILKVVAADVKPDEGFVSVCNYDTVLQAGMVRPRVGFVKHERVLEGGMSGRANLEEQAMLHFFTAEQTERRIAELLPLANLESRITTPANTYTPDEWARLEMVASLIHRPKAWLVDEPTRGCDASGREHVWRAFRQLRSQVSSVLLAMVDETEANELANRVVKI